MAGMAGQEAIIKYSSQEYDKKIDRLADCFDTLKAISDNLEDDIQELLLIWRDPEARQCAELLERQNQAVARAAKKVAALKDVYQTVQTSADSAKSFAGSGLNAAEEAVEKLKL